MEVTRMGFAQVVRLINLVAAGIQTGGQVFCLMAIIPAMRRWPQEMSVQVHQDALTYRPENYLRPFAILEVLTGAILIFLHHRTAALSSVFTGIGVIAAVLNGFISARWEWPINSEVNSWGSERSSERYTEMRATWDEKHAWRTGVSIFALVCFVLAAILRDRD
jgi:hypothetical protein